MDEAVIEEAPDPEVPEQLDESDSDQDLEAFEREYQADHSWEQLAEDDEGRLLPLDPTKEQRARRERLLSQHHGRRIRRGMIRYVQVMLDVSSASSVQDIKPNRFTVMISLMKNFVKEYFDQNPLSQLGSILLRNGQAEKLSELSSSPESHLSKLEQNMNLEGCISLQNALSMALDTLKSVPTHGYREILCLVASLNSCDPGDIRQTIRQLKAEHVRVTFIGIAAEVFIFKHVAEETGGNYSVALTEKHLEQLLMDFIPPPPAPESSTKATLVQMGFPEMNPDGPKGTAFTGSDSKILPGGYTCNRCKARVTDLPCDCHVCGLALVSSPHLARAYHHLFPVNPFQEIDAQQAREMGRENWMSCWGEAAEKVTCFGCLTDLLDEAAGVILLCKGCGNLFCFECDSYIHESLHNCPGCECRSLIGVDNGQGDAMELG